MTELGERATPGEWKIKPVTKQTADIVTSNGVTVATGLTTLDAHFVCGLIKMVVAEIEVLNECAIEDARLMQLIDEYKSTIDQHPELKAKISATEDDRAAAAGVFDESTPFDAVGA